MASESGFSNQLKKGSSQFKTIHSLGSNKFGQSVASKALFEKVASASILSAVEVYGDDGQVSSFDIEITGHTAIVGDILRIDDGDLINYEFDILEIIDGDHLTILPLADIGFFTGAMASIMGWVTNKANADGSQIVSVTIPGIATELKQDDQIALATALNAKDFATAAKQDLLLAELQLKADLTETQPVSLASVPLATGAATATLQTTGNSSLSSIDTKLTSQATAAKQDLLLAELQLKADLTETQPVSIASLPLPSGGSTSALQTTGNSSLSSIDTKLTSQATAAKQDAEAVLIGSVTETAPASDTASSGLNGRLQRIAQRLTSLIALFPVSLGQKTMANSFAVTLASDQGSINSNSTRATVAGTVTQASITVGTTAVRATVAGTAPNAARKRLSIKPSENNTGTIFLGSSTVTTANGMSFIGPDRIDFEFDSGDYYLISDVAGQSVQIIEKV